MKPFAEYASKLSRLLDEAKVGEGQSKELNAALDGQPAAELRRLVDLTVRRTNGAFFSGSRLASRAIRSIKNGFISSSFITDPACGAGDLLLECARHLPTLATLEDTLVLWGRQLCGLDIHEEFVNVARLRLAILAIQRDVPPAAISIGALKRYFPHIKVKNGLHSTEEITRSTHIVVNPPFASIPHDLDFEWTSGLINGSAVFLDFILQHAKEGARLVAILPDVLRSGTRYDAFRDLVAERCTPRRLVLMGRFDNSADVDVFILDAEVGSGSGEYRWKWPTSKETTSVVGDRFDVHVGSLVPFRHKRRGPKRPYLTTQNAPPWVTVSHISLTRRFSGTVFDPPFVVVRRTSRCNDRFRAVATIVNTNSPVAIENHLLVLLPKNRTLKECRTLVRCLKTPETNAWLNDRICCRHLTVSSLASLPYSGT